MSDSNKADPNRPRVAPPPPPPPEISMGQTAQQGGGFNPHNGRMLLEVFAAVVAVAAVGVGLIFAGGWLASQLVAFVPFSVDRKIGELSKEQFALQSADCKNAEALAYVEQIAEPLLAVAGPLPFDFEFRVADTEQVNAFALPGGFVTVNYGLLQKAESGEEVAGVIGHEIQHALLRHGTQRMLRQMGGSALMFLVFGGSDLQNISQVAGQLAGLSHDRDEESEADQRGVELLVKAGIDPSGLSTFFKRLSKDSVTPPELLSTHPDPGDRARLVKEAKKGKVFKTLPSPAGLSCN